MPDSDRPTSPPPPEFDRTERPTLVPCLVCDGEYTRRQEGQDGRYTMTSCPWCTNGAMNEAQRRAWALERAKKTP